MKDNRIVELFYNVATGSGRRKKLLTPVGPPVFFGFIALLVYLSLKTDKALAIPGIFSEPTNRILSLPFIIAGLSLIAWCVLHFHKAKGTPVPFNPPASIVDSGPYAYSRNPMLTGLFVVMFGLGLWLISVSLIAIYLPLFILLNYVELKKVEEPELEKRFGDGYLRYKKRTPMFIPCKRKPPRKKP